jgi:hypothetical protein
MIATAIPHAINAYSIAVAAVSSRKNRITKFIGAILAYGDLLGHRLQRSWASYIQETAEGLIRCVMFPVNEDAQGRPPAGHVTIHPESQRAIGGR